MIITSKDGRFTRVLRSIDLYSGRRYWYCFFQINLFSNYTTLIQNSQALFWTSLCPDLFSDLEAPEMFAYIGLDNKNNPSHIEYVNNYYSQVSIYISCFKGIWLSFFMAFMNYVCLSIEWNIHSFVKVNIFREGMFVIALLSPIVPYLPRSFCDVIEQVGLVFMMMIWTIIPATSLLQWIAMSRWSSLFEPL